MTPIIIGLDIAKNAFEIHGVAAGGRTMLRKPLRRGKVLEFFASLPVCSIRMEACGGAHHWAPADQTWPGRPHTDCRSRLGR